MRNIRTTSSQPHVSSLFFKQPFPLPTLSPPSPYFLPPIYQPQLVIHFLNLIEVPHFPITPDPIPYILLVIVRTVILKMIFRYLVPGMQIRIRKDKLLFEGSGSVKPLPIRIRPTKKKTLPVPVPLLNYQVASFICYNLYITHIFIMLRSRYCTRYRYRLFFLR